MDWRAEPADPGIVDASPPVIDAGYSGPPGPLYHKDTYIKASNSELGDHFGHAVAMDGETLLVGALGEDSAASGVDGDQSNNETSSSGAAYVFTRDGESWSQQAYLKASNPDVNDAFGARVAAFGDTIVITAPHEASAATGINGDQSDNSKYRAGAAYVFVRAEGQWSQQAYLKASNPGKDDTFGRSLCLYQDTLVVGAPGESSNGTDELDNSTESSGAAYVFVREGSTWTQQAYLKASNPKKESQFGTSCTVVEDTLVVGAPGENSGSPDEPYDTSRYRAGAAYVFIRQGEAWTQQAYLKAPLPSAHEFFGSTVSLRGDLLAVGGRDGVGNGFYLFGRSGQEWAYQEGPLLEPSVDNGHLITVELTSQYLVLNNAPGINIFKKSQIGWSSATEIEPPHGNEASRSVALSPTGAVAWGLPGESSSARGINGNELDTSTAGSGAVFVFEPAM